MLEIKECHLGRSIWHYPGTKIPAISAGVNSFGQPMIAFHDAQGEVQAAMVLGKDGVLRRYEQVGDALPFRIVMLEDEDP